MSSINRFLLAQEKDYEIALDELKLGLKKSYSLWYIFPQLKGLDNSPESKERDLKDIEEAKEYLENETLKKRLIEVTEIVLNLQNKKIGDVFKFQAFQFKACMTLFKKVEEIYKIDCGNIFGKALDKFYGGNEDKRTIELLEKQGLSKNILKKSITTYIKNDISNSDNNEDNNDYNKEINKMFVKKSSEYLFGVSLGQTMETHIDKSNSDQEDNNNDNINNKDKILQKEHTKELLENVIKESEVKKEEKPNEIKIENEQKKELLDKTKNEEKENTSDEKEPKKDLLDNNIEEETKKKKKKK